MILKIILSVHGKSFAEESKNLVKYKSENNFVGILSMIRNCKNAFYIQITNLNVLNHYFDVLSSTKLFLDL